MACTNLWTEAFTDWAELDWIEGFTTGTYWIEEGWMEYDWVECEQLTPVVDDITRGGAGGSNKAGKKRKKRPYTEVRIGHAISAIQTPPAWYYDVLPDETQVEETVTDEVETLIAANDVQIHTFEQLVSQIETAIQKLETENIEQRKLREYKDIVRENYKKLVKRRKEEEAIIHILLHAL